MASSELSILLTARGNLQSELQGARDRVKDLSKQIKEINAAGGTVGEELAGEFRDATRAVTKLGSELDQVNRKVKRTANESTGAAAKMGKAWQKAASIFQNDLVAGVSAASLALAGRQAINAYATAEKMQNELNLAYSKFPALANASRDSFDALNLALMSTTGADDDLLASAEAVLARFQLTGTEIQQLIPLVNDYAIATGTDLVSSSETIGKALMGNARALKALGIDFKSTGDTGTDLAQIMQLLENKVGGAGDAFGKTTAGQLTIAQKNFENLQEEIGAALVPALEALVSIAKPMSQAFSGLSDPVKQVAVGVTGLGAAALIATPRIAALNTALASRGGIMAFASKGKSAAAGMAAVAAAYIALDAVRGDAAYNWTPWEGTFEGMAGLNNAMAGLTKGTLDTELGFLAGVGDSMGIVQKQSSSASDAVKRFDAQLATLVADDRQADARKLFDELVQGAQSWGGSVDDVKKLLPGYSSAMDAVKRSTKGAAGALNELEQQLSPLNRAMNRFGHALEVRSALRTWRTALKESIAKPSQETAAAAAEAFLNTVATYKDGGKAQARFVSENYDDILRTINASGIEGAARANLIGPLDDAKRAADDVLTALQRIEDMRPISITFSSSGLPSYAMPGWVNPVRKAVGGLVSGPGTATSDSIPALLSNGEYVIRAAAARRLGLGTLNQLNKADRIPNPGALATQADREALAVAQPLIGQIVVHNPAQDVDVERAVSRSLARAERIRKERQG